MTSQATPPQIAFNNPIWLVQAQRQQALRAVTFPVPALIWVMEGSKELWLGERHCLAQVGQSLLLPAGSEVNLRNLPAPASGRYRALMLNFDRPLLERFASLYPGEADGWQAQDIELLLPPMLELQAALQRLADLAAPDAAASWRQHYLLEVLLHLSSAGLGAALSAGRQHSTGERVRTLVGLAPGHRWTAAELAERLACSEATLRRRLVAEGHSVRGLLDEIRLGSALNLLQTGRLPINAIAAAVGYESPSRFAARFRQRFGTAPSALR
ncbi:helix-turn-helix transcriptional regulator [Chitinimonas sp.]|uniref:helix-turn-helix transcriptional regulator n=1 Tax=Chitinimonas sp. TaxID=1934313 RepID=UPI0035B14406